MKGITPGLQFFESGSNTAYTFIMSLFPANLIMLLIGFLGARWFTKIVRCPNQILISVIIVLMTAGVFTVNNRIFDVYLLMILGTVFYVLRKTGINPMPAVLGFILGPYAEKGIRQTAIISGGDYSIFIQRPACVILIAMILFSLFIPFILVKSHKVL